MTKQSGKATSKRTLEQAKMELAKICNEFNGTFSAGGTFVDTPAAEFVVGFGIVSTRSGWIVVSVPR